MSQPRPVGKSPSPDLTGLNLGSVTLLQKIGEGSMGVVYRGFQPALARPVAVKVVFRDRFNKLFTPERFRQEAEVVANLFHGNIVTIFEFGERPEFLYFVMQLVDGISMSQWLKLKKKHPVPKRRLPSFAELLPLSDQVISVLGFAHEQGVVHRDIKPENILLKEKNMKIMMADFGLASVHYASGEDEKQYVLGSPLYVSPEQARGETVDGRADIFSFGCVLLESSLGFMPAKVERPEKIFQTRARAGNDIFTGTIRDHNPLLPDAWSDFVGKALRPHRDQRFRDAEEMLAALRQITPGLLAWEQGQG
jgi:eukaryotic-like serine/threonine-protein kinase